MSEPVKIEGKLSRADVPNLNGRIFPKEVMQKAVADLQEKIDKRRIFGRVGTQQSQKMKIGDASHVVTDLKMEDERLVAEVEILNTNRGKLLQQFLESKTNLTLQRTNIQMK